MPQHDIPAGAPDWLKNKQMLWASHQIVHTTKLVARIYDRWTRQYLVSADGQWVFSKLDNRGLLEWHLVIIPIIYTLIMGAISYALHRIYFVLPLVFYIVTYVYTSQCDGEWSFEEGIMLLIMAAFTINNWFKKIAARNESTNDLTEFYRTIGMSAKEAMPKQRFFSVHVSIGLLTIIGMIISLTPYIGHTHGLLALLPVIVCLFLSYHVPGVGGHSGTGIIAFVFACIMGIICTLFAIPEIATGLVSLLKALLIPPTQHPGDINIIKQAYDTMSRPQGEMYMAVSGTSYLDVVRYMLGWFVLLYNVADSINGPSYLIQGAADGCQKKDAKDKTPYLAGVFCSQWIWYFFVNVLINLWFASPMMWLCNIVGGTLGVLLHIFVGTKIWSGRGQALALTTLRDNMLANFGDGAVGFRKLVSMAVLVTSITCFHPRLGGAATTGCILLAGLAWRSERLQCFLMAFTTYNLGFVFAGITSNQPITSDITANAVNAYSATFGNHSSKTSAPQTTQSQTTQSPPAPAAEEETNNPVIVPASVMNRISDYMGVRQNPR